VLVYAAAGGVGSALIQLAKMAGKTVLALAGSDAKMLFAKAQGADHTFNHRAEGLAEKIGEVTGGRGADIVLDPIGGPDFASRLDLLAPLGTLVLYGLLGGWPAHPDIMAALRRHIARSLGIRTFSMHAFDSEPEVRARATEALLGLLSQAHIKPAIHDRIPLADAAKAHSLLENGGVMGKVVLHP